MEWRSLQDMVTNILSESPKSRTWLLKVHNKYQLNYCLRFIEGNSYCTIWQIKVNFF